MGNMRLVYEYDSFGHHDAHTHAAELRREKAYPLVTIRRWPRSGSLSVRGWMPLPTPPDGQQPSGGVAQGGEG